MLDNYSAKKDLFFRTLILTGLIVTLTGISAGFTVDGDATADEREFTTGIVNLNEIDDRVIGLETGENIEGEEVEKKIHEFDGFDKTNPDAGKEVDLGLIYPNDDEVNFGDEVEYIDSDTGEEIDDYYNLNIRRAEDGTYYFLTSGSNPSTNFDDVIRINGKVSETTTENEIDLTERFEFENSYGAVTFFDINGDEETVYVDNAGLEYEEVYRAEGSKKKIKIELDNTGAAPIDRESLENDQGEIRDDLFKVQARESKLGAGEALIADIEFNEESNTFKVNLENKVGPTEELDVFSNPESEGSVQDRLGNGLSDSVHTVRGFYSDAPEVKIDIEEESMTHGDRVEAEIFARSLERPSLELSFGYLDIVSEPAFGEWSNCGDSEWQKCYEAVAELEFNSGSSGINEVEAVVSNENGDNSASESVEIMTGSGKVTQILLKDEKNTAGIDTAEVKFDVKIDPDTYQGNWKMNGKDLVKSRDSSDLSKTLKLELNDGSLETTDADKVDVTHSPTVDSYLEYEDGSRVEEIDEGDISEKDESSPVLKDIEAVEGYDIGVLKFSEPVNSMISSPWDVEIIKEDGQNTDQALAEFSGEVKAESHGQDEKWEITTEDSSGNEQASESGMTFDSGLIGVREGGHIVSLPEQGRLAGNEEDTTLREQYDWINSAFNYDQGWDIARGLRPNRGTYIVADSAGTLKFESGDSDSEQDLPDLPTDISDGWNLVSPFNFKGGTVFADLRSENICDSDAEQITPVEEGTQENLCDSKNGIEDSELDVFRGYWMLG